MKIGILGSGMVGQALATKLAEGEQAFDKWVDRLDRGLIDEEQFGRLNGAHLAERRQLNRGYARRRAGSHIATRVALGCRGRGRDGLRWRRQVRQSGRWPPVSLPAAKV